MLPLVLGGPARSGELLQQVAQRRVGQTQHLLTLIQHKKYKNNKGKNKTECTAYPAESISVVLHSLTLFLFFSDILHLIFVLKPGLMSLEN